MVVALRQQGSAAALAAGRFGGEWRAGWGRGPRLRLGDTRGRPRGPGDAAEAGAWVGCKGLGEGQGQGVGPCPLMPRPFLSVSKACEWTDNQGRWLRTWNHGHTARVWPGLGAMLLLNPELPCPLTEEAGRRGWRSAPQERGRVPCAWRGGRIHTMVSLWDHQNLGSGASHPAMQAEGAVGCGREIPSFLRSGNWNAPPAGSSARASEWLSQAEDTGGLFLSRTPLASGPWEGLQSPSFFFLKRTGQQAGLFQAAWDAKVQVMWGWCWSLEYLGSHPWYLPWGAGESWLSVWQKKHWTSGIEKLGTETAKIPKGN